MNALPIILCLSVCAIFGIFVVGILVKEYRSDNKENKNAYQHLHKKCKRNFKITLEK